MTEKKIISVVGGSGFVGKYLVDSLLSKGFYVKIISRNAKFKKSFYPSSKLGQLTLINCNIKNTIVIQNKNIFNRTIDIRKNILDWE